MLKFFTTLLLIFSILLCQGQVKVYVKFTPYSGGPTIIDENPNAGLHTGEFLISTFSDNDSQTLNIGSQSTGAGAGKVSFESLNFTKSPGANSAQFFKMMANGTPFQYVEFNFYNSNDQKVYKIVLGLVAIKSIARAAASCTANCPGIIENYAIEYGGKNITVYDINPTTGTVTGTYTAGWNRVKNVAWDNTATPIQ